MLACITSDWHFGIIFEDLDRTQDINKIANDIVNDAIKRNCKFFINLGDTYHTNKPLPYIEALLISILNKLEDNKIETYWLIGNHEVINDYSKRHALEPIKKIRYKYIHIIDDVMLVELSKYKLSFLFLPHISKSYSKKELNCNPQKYIEELAKKYYKDSCDEYKLYVFSHLNVKDAQFGIEKFMIKGENEDFPEFLKHAKKVKYIFNGHIHKAQVIKEKNPILIPGSVECINFGERDDKKGYLIVDL